MADALRELIFTNRLPRDIAYKLTEAYEAETKQWAKHVLGLTDALERASVKNPTD